MSADLQTGLLRRRRVRHIRQTEVAECGLASLAMVGNFHGLNVDIAALRRRFRLSLRGLNLRSLVEIADQLGLRARAVKITLDDLDKLSMPLILHWDMRHFVVVEAIKNNKFLVHDPASSSRWVSLSEMSSNFTGIALEISTANDFKPLRIRQQLKISQLWQEIFGFRRAIGQLIVLSLFLQAFSLASPYYMQVALDSALPALDHRLLAVLALGFGLFVVFNVLASLIRSFIIIAAGTALGYEIAANVARRLFRLPVSWFERRHVGDVLSRFQSIAPIKKFLAEDATAACLDGSLALLTLAVMAFYSLPLTLIALVAFTLYGTLRAGMFIIQRNAQEHEISLNGIEQSALIESIRGMATLRLYGRESARHAVWQNKLTDATNASVEISRLKAWQAAASALIVGLENIISIWFAIGLVMSGGFSTGMVFAYMAYKTQFLQKAISLIDQTVAFRLLGLHLERLGDIALTEEDLSFKIDHAPYKDLVGSIELRDVSYRYGPTDPPVLDSLCLTVAPGEHVAITGPSGGGKSTLLKILVGLLEPDSGLLIVDGQDAARFGYKNFHSQTGAVLQDDHLFAGTLADNIALFDDTPDIGRIAMAARTAALAEDIAAMPMGFETMVGDMGSTLSGGQRQRVLLARALYKNPRVLIMDEGTSHLDSERERDINAAVSSLGITRIVAAHRNETVASADRILELRAGRLTDITSRIRREDSNYPHASPAWESHD